MKKLPSQHFFKNKRVLVRVDFNVELRKGRVIDDFRIRQTLPTIKYLQKTASKLILISHLSDEAESLAPVAKHLSKLLKKKVYFVPGKTSLAGKTIEALPLKSIVLLENLRFDKGEKENQLAFAKKLASLADIFVFDSFGVNHRRAASVIGVPKLLPSFFGFLMESELKNLGKLKKRAKKLSLQGAIPRRNEVSGVGPFVAILGGAKLKTKLPLIKSFIKKSDYILLGGGIANTGLLSLGLKLGKSLAEPKQAKQIKKYSQLKSVFLPVDFLVAKSKTSKSAKLFSSSIDKNSYVLDIGPETIRQYQEIIKSAKTIIWNGPMGYYENPVFAKGTKAIAKAVLANKKAFKIIGGGDTTAFLRNAKITNSKSQIPNLFISTGGGAMLEYLAGSPSRSLGRSAGSPSRSLGRSAGKKLPGIAALEKDEPRRKGGKR